MRPNDDIYFAIQFEIGEKGGRGQDLFQVMVATPEALMKRSNEFLISDRAYLIVQHWDWQRTEHEIRRIIESCAAQDFNQSVTKLQRYFRWEYE